MTTHDPDIEYEDWKGADPDDEITFKVIHFEESIGFVRGFDNLREVFEKAPKARLEPDPAHDRRCFECGRRARLSRGGWKCRNGHVVKLFDKDGIVYRNGFHSEGMGILEESDYEKFPFNKVLDWFRSDDSEGKRSGVDIEGCDQVRVTQPGYDGPVGRTESRPMVSSVEWYRDPGHHRIVVYNRGGQSGGLAVEEGDGRAMVLRLMGADSLDELNIKPMG